MAEVDILMAAYNGEKYIAEQIESLLAQTYQDFRLLIRDDGSSDRTPAIIEDYAAKYPSKIEVVHDDVECHDAAKNFFQLLTYAEADYVMFSDQDDVWLPYKIQITLDCMKETERKNPGKPVCVFTALEVVDADLKRTGEFIIYNIPANRLDFGKILYSNLVAGCTQMINREVYQNIGEYTEDMYYHDWWTTLYASAFGEIVHLNKPTILYRQHEGNVVGALTHKVFGKKGYLYRLCRIIFNSKQKIDIFYKEKRQKELFRSRYLSRISPQKLAQIDECLELFSTNKLTRIKALVRVRGFRDFIELNFIRRVKRVLYHLLF